MSPVFSQWYRSLILLIYFILQTLSSFLQQVTLTDSMMEKLSTEIQKEDIYLLAFKLGISHQEVDRTFTKKCTDKISIKKAILDVLQTWLRGQSSPQEAYTALREAMKHPDVKLNMIVTETLDCPTTKPPAKRKRKSNPKESTDGKEPQS